MEKSVLAERSMLLAIRIVNLHKQLWTQHKEAVLSRQLLRSGTAVGALLREATYAESAADFVHKLAISQKECYETAYWLELLWKTDYLLLPEYESLQEEVTQILKMLTASIKTVKSRRGNEQTITGERENR